MISIIEQSDIYRHSAELGYWLGEPYWGKGIVTEAVKMISSYGFNELKIERIFAGVFDFNKASINVLQKNGYQLEGISKNGVIKNNIIRDEHRFYKLRSDSLK